MKSCINNLFNPTANEARTFAAAFALTLSTYVYWLFTSKPLNNYWECSAIVMHHAGVHTINFYCFSKGEMKVKTPEKIYNFAKSHYKQINPDAVIDAAYALSNRACHYNAVAAARAGRADKVWLVWAGRKNGVVHFINSKNGKFFDETWHDDEDKSCYWIIREVKPHEYDNVYDILVSTKIALMSMFGNPLQKLTVNKKPHGVI